MAPIARTTPASPRVARAASAASSRRRTGFGVRDRSRTAPPRCLARTEVEVSSTAEGLAWNEGRWKGVLCNLNRDGSPQELPPMYVPDAFREWGETLYEWNTLCETRAMGGSGAASPAHVTQDVRRQVPLTACESVQAQYETEGFLSTEETACACVATPGGDVVIADGGVSTDDVAHSVSLRCTFALSPSLRLRLEVVVKRYLSNESFQLHSGKVFAEERTDEWIDSEVLDTDGGVRQTNEVADTERGGSREAAGWNRVPLPMGAFLDMQTTGETSVRLNLGAKTGALCSARYEDGKLARAEITHQ